MTERLKELNKLGQSIWYDNIQRSMFSNGQFDELIAAGVLGMTSNPSIFNNAISGSTDYDASISELYNASLDLDAIYEQLVLEDIALSRQASLGWVRPLADAQEVDQAHPCHKAADVSAPCHAALLITRKQGVYYLQYKPKRQYPTCW